MSAPLLLDNICGRCGPLMEWSPLIQIVLPLFFFGCGSPLGVKVSMVSNVQREEKRRLRLARMAVDIFFFLNGVMSATFSTRLPAVQMKLVLPPGQLGLALLGCTIGGLFAMNIAGRVSSRFESKGITTIAALSACITLPLVALAPTMPLFLLALVLFGAGSGAMEVTMNLQGTAVEREYGRSILNSFHAYFSVGSLAGALLGSILAALDVQPGPHFFAITVVGCVVLVWSSRFLANSSRVECGRASCQRGAGFRPCNSYNMGLCWFDCRSSHDWFYR